MEPQDTITIAPSVLIAVARHAAAQVHGVSRIGTIPVDMLKLLKGSPKASGVVLDITGDQVDVDIYVLLKPSYSMKDVSAEVQVSVTRAIEELVGMTVKAVNVHVEDVDFLPSASSEVSP